MVFCDKLKYGLQTHNITLPWLREALPQPTTRTAPGPRWGTSVPNAQVSSSMLEAEANLSSSKPRPTAEDKHSASRSVWLKWLRIAGLFERCSSCVSDRGRCDGRRQLCRLLLFQLYTCQLVNAMIPSLIALLTWQLTAWLAFALVEQRSRTRLSISKQSTRYHIFLRVRLMFPIFLRVET